MLKTIYISIFVLFLWTSLHAQNYRFTHYTTENSFLPQNQIISLFQDSKGNLWVGTKFGAVKYDGKNHTTYNAKNGILSGDIDNIFETSGGAILLCSTRSGINVISNEKINTYPLEKKYQRYQYLQAGDSIIIFARWMSDNNRVDLLVFYKNKIIKKVDIKTNLTNFALCCDTIWVSSNLGQGKGITGYLDSNFQFRQLDNTFVVFKANRNTLYINDLKFGKQGTYVRNDIYKYRNGKKSLFLKNSYVFYLTEKNIFTLSNTETDSIKIYDYSGNLQDSIHIAGFKTMIEDKEKNLWFGTEYGLYKLANRAFRHYLFKDYGITPNNVQLTIYKNEFWLSVYSGHLYKFENNRFIDYTDKLPAKKVSFMIGHAAKSSGEIIWGTQASYDNYYGLIIKKGKGFFRKIQGYTSFYSFYYDTLQHKLLGGYQKGLLVMDDDYRILNKIDTLKKLYYPTGIEKDTSGYYWVSSRKAIYRYKNKNIEQIDLDMLKSGALQIIHDSKHNLWFGGEGGLIFYNNKTFRQIKHNALKDKAITTLQEVGDSVLLIGTTSGLVTMDLKSFYSKNKTVMKSYNADNGFSGYECMQSGFVEDENGIVWVAVNDRMISIDPRKLNFDNVPVAPYITGLFVLKDAKWIKQDTNVLDYDKNKIKFEFAGAYFSNPVLYSYKLEGFDKNWSEYDDIQTAVYTNLPYGKYTFKVKAINGEEESIPLMAEYVFVKKKALWENWWFYLIIAVFSGIIIAVIFKLILKRKVEKQLQLLKMQVETQDRIKQEIASALHSSEGGLLSFVIMDLQNKNADGSLTIDIEKLKEHHKNVRNQSHLLDLPDFRETDIEEELSDLIENFRTENLIINEHYLSKKKEWSGIHPVILQNIYRIVQELLTNTVKYAEATKIEISLLRNNDELILSYSDNGSGYDPKQIKQGMGYKKEIIGRTKAMGGKFVDETQTGDGVRLYFFIPI